MMVFKAYVRLKSPSEICPRRGHAGENGGHGAQGRQQFIPLFRRGRHGTLAGGSGGHERRPALIDFGKVGTLIADARHHLHRT